MGETHRLSRLSLTNGLPLLRLTTGIVQNIWWFRVSIDSVASLDFEGAVAQRIGWTVDHRKAAYASYGERSTDLPEIHTDAKSNHVKRRLVIVSFP